MLVEVRPKSQITIPKEIVNSLNLSVGDKLDFYEKDGVIYAVPVVVYPKQYVEELQLEVAELKKEYDFGKRKSYSDVESMIENLESQCRADMDNMPD